MTVRQLRDWLIKQDETGTVSVATGEAIEYSGYSTDFKILVESELDAQEKKP